MCKKYLGFQQILQGNRGSWGILGVEEILGFQEILCLGEPGVCGNLVLEECLGFQEIPPPPLLSLLGLGVCVVCVFAYAWCV